jgi:hypothetical protein
MSNETSVVSEIVKFLLQAFIVGFGWLVVHKLSSARDKDKLRREMLAKTADGLSEDLNKLLTQARDYHLKVRDKNVEVTIKIMLQDLSMRTVFLSDLCNDKDELRRCRTALINFKKSVSGMHFEDEHTEALEINDHFFEVMALEYSKVKSAFVKLKHKQFPPT